MDRDVALPFVVGLLAVVALALAAATVDTAVVTEGGSGLGGTGDDRLIGTGDEGDVGDDTDPPAVDSPDDELGFGACWPAVREPPVLAAIGLFFVALFAAAFRSTGSAFAGIVVCFAAAHPIGLAWVLLAICGSPSLEALMPGGVDGGAGNLSLFPTGGGSLGDGAAGTVSSPSVLVGALIAIAVAVLAAALLFGRRDSDDTTEATGEPSRDPDRRAAVAVGRAAGDAADRIEGATSVENEVYRAWRRMTDALEVDSPETTSPAGFAEAAVDAGMDPGDVSALTDLFERVRYGGAEPTPEREREAIATLRRIEDAYGERVEEKTEGRGLGPKGEPNGIGSGDGGGPSWR